jgi:pimeloyl-ACP methyl ester carboxylesterase
MIAKKLETITGIAFLIMLALSSCSNPAAALPTSTPAHPTPTIIPPTPVTVIDKKIDIGGYGLWIQCFGQGTPAVIVEAGMGDPAINTNSSWKVVTSAIAQTTQICLYNRAGVSPSDGVPVQDQYTRTSQDMVKDLQTLLVNANVPPPYILVGHSIGGYNVRLYASQYQNEVVGMVLVDSSHPDQWSEMAAVLPPEQPDESGGLKAIRSDITNPSSNPERMDVIASAAQVRATKSLDDLPLVVVSSRKHIWNMVANFPPDLSAKLDQIWQDLQIDLAGLSSNSAHIIATQAGHFIQVDEPQLVIDAILKVISQAKK